MNNNFWGINNGLPQMQNTGWNMPVQQQASNGSFMTVIVNGEAGANTYPVAAGNTVLLIDFNTRQFWLKTTDPNSVPQPLRSFKFEEVVQATPTQQDAGNYVTKAEFAELKKMLEDLTAPSK